MAKLLKHVETPQEIELWVMLPAIKKCLTKILLKKHKLKQNEIAKLLNVTPSAVSQYLSKKRGSSIIFVEDALNAIEETANKIVQNKSKPVVEIITLLKKKEIRKMVCEIHRKIDPSFENCHIC